MGLGRASGEGQCWVEWGRVGSGRVGFGSGRVGSGRHQLAGGILKAVADGLNTMVKEPVLAKCLFEFPTYARLTHMNVEDVLVGEDEAALTFAKLNLATAFCRIKRLTFMLLGPSPNSVFFAGGDVCEKEALARLQRDVDNDIYFRSIADDVTGIRELVDRSVFDWIANKQIVGVLKAVDFRPTTDTHNFFQVENSHKVPEKFQHEAVMVPTMISMFDEVGDRCFAEFWEKALSEDGHVDWGRKPLYTPVMGGTRQLAHVVLVSGDPDRVPSHIRIGGAWQFNDGISDMRARFGEPPAFHYVREFFEDKAKGPHKYKLDPKGNHLKALAQKVVLDEANKRKELEDMLQQVGGSCVILCPLRDVVGGNHHSQLCYELAPHPADARELYWPLWDLGEWESRRITWRPDPTRPDPTRPHSTQH